MSEKEIKGRIMSEKEIYNAEELQKWKTSGANISFVEWQEIIKNQQKIDIPTICKYSVIGLRETMNMEYRAKDKTGRSLSYAKAKMYYDDIDKIENVCLMEDIEDKHFIQMLDYFKKNIEDLQKQVNDNTRKRRDEMERNQKRS